MKIFKLCKLLVLLGSFHVTLGQTGCSNPGNIEPGAFISTADSNFDVGANVAYTCRLGYALSPPSASTAIQCQSDFTWTEPVFKCNLRDCGEPESLRNGVYSIANEATTFGSLVTYTCNTGYTMISGNARHLCATSGTADAPTWQGILPVCRVNVCPSFDDIDNGSIDDFGISSHDYGTSLAISCNRGYKLSDPLMSEVVCGADGVWGDFPTCEVDYGCKFEERGDDFPCGYTNIGWTREALRGVDNRIGFSASVQTSAGATLTSTAFKVPPQGACLSFYYKIDSGNVAELTVSLELSDGSGSPVPLLKESSVTSWKNKRLELSNAGDSIVWTFRVSAQAAKIYVDFITVENQSCTEPTTEPSTVAQGEATTPGSSTPLASTIGETSPVAITTQVSANTDNLVTSATNATMDSIAESTADVTTEKVGGRSPILSPDQRRTNYSEVSTSAVDEYLKISQCDETLYYTESLKTAKLDNNAIKNAMAKLSTDLLKGYQRTTEGWLRPFNGYEYFLTSFRDSFKGCRKVCQSHGGDLAHYGMRDAGTRMILYRGIPIDYSTDAPHFGLLYKDDAWEWLDGAPATNETIFFDTLNKIRTDGNCGETYKTLTLTGLCTSHVRCLCERFVN